MRKTYNILLLILIPTATIYAQEEAESDSRVGVAVVPIIDYDPTFSLSIGAAGQLFYQLSDKDTISPLSSTGFFGMHTFNGSLGLAGFQKFHLNEDRWRIFTGGGLGFRYLMLPEERINIGIDAAFGKEDWGGYFRIGEAFGR